MEKVTTKELQVKMNIGKNMAGQLIRDIKEEYGIKIVTMSHVIHYLKIPHPQSI